MVEINESSLPKAKFRALNLNGSMGAYQLVQTEGSPSIGVYDNQTGQFLGGFQVDEKNGNALIGYPPKGKDYSLWKQKAQDVASAFNQQGGLEEFSKLPLKVSK